MPHEPGQRPSATRTIFDRDILRSNLPVLPRAGNPVLIIVGSTSNLTADIIRLNNVEGLAYADGIVHCACYGGSRYAAVDVSTPNAPVILSSITSSIAFPGTLGGVTEITLKDNYAILAGYNTGHVTTVDFADIVNPVIVDAIGGVVGGPLYHARGIVRGVGANSNFAFVSTEDDWVHSINISDPTSLGVAGSVNDSVLLDRAWHITIDNTGTVVFVACTTPNHRVVSIDVSDPFNPQILHSYQSSTLMNSPWGISYRSGYLYVGCTSVDDFVILDATDPANLQFVGAGSASVGLGIGTSMATHPLASNYVVTAGSSGNYVALWDVSDPEIPSRIQILGDAAGRLNGARDVIVNPNGRYVYVASYNASRVAVIEVT